MWALDAMGSLSILADVFRCLERLSFHIASISLVHFTSSAEWRVKISDFNSVRWLATPRGHGGDEDVYGTMKARLRHALIMRCNAARACSDEIYVSPSRGVAHTVFMIAS